MRKGYSYDDVLLSPKYGVLEKRAYASVKSRMFETRPIDVPIIAAPMTSVTDGRVAKEMALAGAGAVIPRFQPVEQQLAQYNETYQAHTVACAIGYDISRFNFLHNMGVRRFCLDVAHAHHFKTEETLRAIRNEMNDIELIVGNVATGEAARWLERLGVTTIKVGIGPGAACSTREVTGFGVPQLSAVMECRKALRSNATCIVADGGIKNSGDIVKALAAGANTVMVGQLFAQCAEAPGMGEYWGMASKRVNNHHAPEGVTMTIVQRTTVAELLKKLVWGIKSGISYAGARNIPELQANAEFIECAPGVERESATRMLE